jgi:hypothetical protein
MESVVAIQARQIDMTGLDGPAIGEKLRRVRIEAITEALAE